MWRLNRVAGIALIVAMAGSNLSAPVPAEAQTFRNGGTIQLAGITSVPFRLSGNHIYIKVLLGGRPFGFIFDTGGAATLEPAAQKVFHFPVVSRQVSHSGKDVDVVRIGRFEVGNAAYLNGTFPVIRGPVGLDTPFGVPFGGVIGSEFIASLVTKIDYAHARLSFENPKHFEPDSKAAALPMSLRGGFFPSVEASIDGHAGRFDIDSGLGRALIVSQAFADSSGASTGFTKHLNVLVGVMLSGPVFGTVVRAHSFSIGPYMLKDPIAMIAPPKGMYGDPDLAGTIGGEILRRFTVTLDVPDSKIYFAPNPLLAAAFVFNRSGISSIRAAQGESVVVVSPDTPADEAGVKAGDVIVAINKRNVLSMPHDRFVDVWLGVPGTKVSLTILRNSRVVTSTVTLRNLL